MSNAANDRVMECANVKAVTTLTMLTKAGAAMEFHRFPLALTARENRGQQQRQQKQQVIDLLLQMYLEYRRADTR